MVHCVQSGFCVVFTGIWLMWKRLGCVHTLTMLSPWLRYTFNRYVLNNSHLYCCHLILPAPLYVMCFFSNSVMGRTICRLRTILEEIKINFYLLEIFWTQFSFYPQLKSKTKEKEVEDQTPIEEFVRHALAFCESLYDPYRNWRQRIAGYVWTSTGL